MTLPARIETAHVIEAIDNGLRIAALQTALRKLSWRKQEGDEELAPRIEREIARLRAEEAVR